ncbi:hypothetical protein PENFLA_c005G05422 [Penicillium flavigenum]|uniref:Tyrosine specific protein phosphatases domain-containing protein n=1 Tax=Penicillium flavigenum TaxID=254877 RepID=A0A1V6TQ06_9EURO|nr:hypothetical protein PENFLA_c005G05422 [Penicillium flavigenum]
MAKIIDVANHPVLVHCNYGKHRTACVISCLRKMQGWKLSDIIDEYRLYADPKARPLDEDFTQQYEPRSIIQIALEASVDRWEGQ